MQHNYNLCCTGISDLIGSCKLFSPEKEIKKAAGHGLRMKHKTGKGIVSLEAAFPSKGLYWLWCCHGM